MAIHPLKSSRQKAFTLVEILVVVGIIAILVSVLMTVVFRTMRNASKLRTKADFQVISTALEAYKQDFGDIPRLPLDNAGVPMFDTGAAILGKALLGPYGDSTPPADPPQFQSVAYKAGDCVTDGTRQWVALVDMSSAPSAAYPSWTHFDANDGLKGPGFRVRAGGQPKSPYIAPNKIKNQGVYLLDHNGGPILYFPARPGRVNVNDSALVGLSQAYVDKYPAAFYNAKDNFEVFWRRIPAAEPEADVLKRIRIMLNDFDASGYIQPDQGEVAINEPFLLWSPGPDGIFGPTAYPMTPFPAANENRRAVEKCDDVTNFR